MLIVARIVFFAFAALLILGGIDGYVAAKSVMSLAAGILCGGLGLAAAILLPGKPSTALILALVGAILALGGMAPRIKSKKTGEIVIWPALVVVVASALTAAVAGGTMATMRGNGGTPPSSSAR